MTYTKANKLFQRIIASPSKGYFPQFVITALVRAFNEQYRTGRTVQTHHPEGSDTSDRYAGDVEVLDADSKVVDAYEVTVRPDWKNRRPDLLKKIQSKGLESYNIICLTEGDPDLDTPGALDEYMSPLGQDIAVVNIRSFVEVSLQQLKPEARSKAIEYMSEYVLDPKLCGVPVLEEKLKELLDESVDQEERSGEA